MKPKPKPYDTEEHPLPKACEPTTAYGRTNIGNDGVLASFSNPDPNKEIPEWYKSRFEQWKAEADEIYGANKRMTPEEYFDKVWYVVEKAYENL